MKRKFAGPTQPIEIKASHRLTFDGIHGKTGKCGLCGTAIKEGYKLCYSCFNTTATDKCSVCGKQKQPSFKTCYSCHSKGVKPAAIRTFDSESHEIGEYVGDEHEKKQIDEKIAQI